MNDIKKENERSKAFSDEKQNPPINTPQSASHKSDEKHTGKEVEQIAFPANPLWYDKCGEFFSSSWCPLYGEIPESFKADNLTKQCVRIIEESRKIWRYFPQPDISKYSEWKLKLAQEMWNLFYTHFTSIFESQTYKDGTVDLECMRIINWTRKIPTLELKKLTDFEIVALFAIYVTWRALEDWLTVEKGESLVCLHPPFDEYSFVKEKMHIALSVLSQAKKMASQTQEENKKEKITQPEYKSEKQTKTNVFRWCNGTWEITFDGVTIRPPDSFGLRYIHYLLEKHGKGIPASELRKIVADKDNEKLLRKRGKEVTAEDVFPGGKSDVKIDKQAEKEYKLRLGELENEIKCAEEKGCELELSELEKEKETLINELKSSTNIFGRSRKLGEKADTDRIAVKQNIETALNTILMGNKSLSIHLKEHIKTGSSCFYPSGFNWILK